MQQLEHSATFDRVIDRIATERGPNEMRSIAVVGSKR